MIPIRPFKPLLAWAGAEPSVVTYFSHDLAWIHCHVLPVDPMHPDEAADDSLYFIRIIQRECTSEPHRERIAIELDFPKRPAPDVIEGTDGEDEDAPLSPLLLKKPCVSV